MTFGCQEREKKSFKTKKRDKATKKEKLFVLNALKLFKVGLELFYQNKRIT